jgi:hypothetical protein
MSRRKRCDDAARGDAHERDHASGTEAATEPATDPLADSPAEERTRRIAKRMTWDAFQALAAVMRDEKAAPTARVNAANTILEWGHGKRGDLANDPEVIEKIVKIDWGPE